MKNKKNSITFNIFTCHFYPHLGGIESYVYNLGIHLIKLGYVVNVISANTEKIEKHAVIDGINVFRLSSFEIFNGRFSVPYSVLDLLYIIYNFYFNRKSITVSNTRFFLTTVIGVFIGRIFSYRNVVIDHGSGHFSYSNRLLNAVSHFYEHLITGILKLLNPFFFGVSQSSCEWLKHFEINPRGIAYNGVDCQMRVENNNAIFKKFHLSKRNIIFYAGRLIEEKGIMQLIFGFKDFASKFRKNKWVLVIAGTGDLDNKIMEITNKDSNIVYVGRLEKKDVYYFLSKTSIFVNPSNYPEGLPTILLEAGNFGLTVISTPNGGAKEVIIDGHSGYIIKEGTRELIKDGLICVVNNPRKSRTMSNNLKTMIKNRFNWPLVTTRLIKEIAV